MAKKTGRVTIKLDGAPLVSKPGASLQIGGVQREPDTSDQGQVFYKETIVHAMVNATMIHTSETDLLALRDFAGGTLNFECDTGVVYVIDGAFTTELGDLSNGEVDISLAGLPAEQAPAAG